MIIKIIKKMFPIMVHIIIVLGCSKILKNHDMNDESIYTTHHHAYARVMKTYEVYNIIDDENKFVICSGYNGQAEKMKNFLVEKGIEKDNIFTESYSKNTVENCILSYELLNKWMEINENFSNITIHLVTNKYHIDRSEKIFQFFQERLNYPVNNIFCYGSELLSYLENVTESDQIELEEAISKEKHIIDNILDKLLLKYKNWHPMLKDYSKM